MADIKELPGEYETVGMALLVLLNDCPWIPAGVKLCYNQAIDTECIVLRTMGGSYTPDVLGGYSARLTFQLGYKSFPNSNAQSIKAQQTADNIMRWLRDSEKPALTDGRTIEKLEISDCLPIIGVSEQDKAITYVANGVLRYEK